MIYKGCRFRSILEAKWAAFFDGMGWNWTYEAFSLYGWYPDFVIHGLTMDFLVEVKPFAKEEEFRTLEPKIGDAVLRSQKWWSSPILLLGYAVVPRPVFYKNRCTNVGHVGYFLTFNSPDPHNIKATYDPAAIVDDDLFYRRCSMIKGGDFGLALENDQSCDRAILEFNTAGALTQWKRKETD